MVATASKSFYRCLNVEMNRIETMAVTIKLFYHKGTAHFKNVNNWLNNNINSYLDTSGGECSDPYLNVVHFFNTIVN